MEEQKKKTSKEMLNELVIKHYEGALQAKAEGKPVVWATSISPQELLETMDLAVVYPENHAAAIGARKGSMEFISQSEGKGYSSDLCSYARVNMGYVDIKEAEAQNIPLPDLILCTNNICNTVIKWYENIAQQLKIPMIMFDTPFSYQYQISDESIKYMRSQFDCAILQLEDFTGRKFDHDKLGEVMKVSNSTSTWWKKATDLAKHTPSPLSGFDMFNYMAMVVCMRGNKDGETLFKLWYEELEDRIKNNLGPWNNAEEKFRIMWDGIACWPHLATTFKTLKKYGVNMVASTYPDSWNIQYEANDLDALVRAYASHYANRNIPYGVDNIKKIAEDFSLDGIIFHSNRSCKLMDFRQYEIQRQIYDLTGVPSVIFDGDQTDPRVFSDAQYETRIQALVEVMAEAKEKRGK